MPSKQTKAKPVRVWVAVYDGYDLLAIGRTKSSCEIDMTDGWKKWRTEAPQIAIRRATLTLDPAQTKRRRTNAE